MVWQSASPREDFQKENGLPRRFAPRNDKRFGEHTAVHGLRRFAFVICTKFQEKPHPFLACTKRLKDFRIFRKEKIIFFRKIPEKIE
jgi:hypothetical protein